MKKLLSIKRGKSWKKIDQAIKAIDLPTWYIEAKDYNGNYFSTKVNAINRKQALDAMYQKMVYKNYFEPYKIISISCI